MFRRQTLGRILGQTLGLGTSLGELFPDNPCGFSTICPKLPLQVRRLANEVDYYRKWLG